MFVNTGGDAGEISNTTPSPCQAPAEGKLLLLLLLLRTRMAVVTI